MAQVARARLFPFERPFSTIRGCTALATSVRIVRCIRARWPTTKITIRWPLWPPRGDGLVRGQRPRLRFWIARQQDSRRRRRRQSRRHRNKLPLNADWDLDLLKLELGELKDSDFDLSLIGFSDARPMPSALMSSTAFCSLLISTPLSTPD